MTHPKDDETLPAGQAPARAASPEDIRQAPIASPPGEATIGTTVSARSSPPQALRAGDYRLGSMIGMGGFGVVYRAEHVARGSKAAVKIPYPDVADDPPALARFAREIEAIRRLRHPNVVDILDVGSLDDGRPYFAMELLIGTSLQDHLRACGRLSPEEALGILEPLCGALEAAHAHAIVHRDIKPSNVFLCDPAGRRRVVLLDFGIAKLLDPSAPALTTSRAVVGTLASIAPEQLLGAPIDPRTDVYALGALLYTMLTGVTPFSNAPPSTVRQLMLEGRVPRPSSRARVSLALEEVILRAMSRAKEARHPSAMALLADFRRAVAREAGSDTGAAPAPERRALGLYVEVIADPDALLDGDERLFADFESILPSARAHLVDAGFLPAVEVGTATLLVAMRAEDPEQDTAQRRYALSTAVSLYQRLQTRAGRDARVSVHLCLHGGELLRDAHGAPVGGDLLELAAWVPDRPEPGVFASAPALEGLGIPAAPCGPSAGALRCIIGAAAPDTLASSR